MIPTVPYGAPSGPGLVEFRFCPQCGHHGDLSDNVCGDPNCEECGLEPVVTCAVCGYEQHTPPTWLDPIDPTGKRPDEWAVEKGHLVLRPDGEMDATWIPFALCDAAERRRWPVPQEHPEYRISERAYDAALADTSFESPMPIKAGGT